jgi:hypothetical protein
LSRIIVYKAPWRSPAPSSRPEPLYIRTMQLVASVEEETLYRQSAKPKSHSRATPFARSERCSVLLLPH